MNINDLFKDAEAAEDAYEQDGLLGSDDLPKGTQLRAKISYSGAGLTNAGAPKWTNKLQVVEDGPLQGREFWDSIYMSANPTAGGARFNKQAFAKLAAAGLTPSFFDANPSAEAIADAIKGVEVLVTIDWETDDKGSVWGRHVWSPAVAAASGPAGFSAPEGF